MTSRRVASPSSSPATAGSNVARSTPRESSARRRHHRHRLPQAVLPRAVAASTRIVPTAPIPIRTSPVPGSRKARRRAARPARQGGRRAGRRGRHQERRGPRTDDRREPRSSGSAWTSFPRPRTPAYGAPVARLRRADATDRPRSRLRSRASHQRRGTDRRCRDGRHADARGGSVRAEALAAELEAVHERRRDLRRRPSMRRASSSQRTSVLGLGSSATTRAPGSSASSPVASLTAWLALWQPRLVRRRGSRLGPGADRLPRRRGARGLRRTPRRSEAACGGRRLQVLPGSSIESSDAFAALPRPFPVGPFGEPKRPGRLVVDLVLPARLLGWTLADELARLAP